MNLQVQNGARRPGLTRQYLELKRRVLTVHRCHKCGRRAKFFLVTDEGQKLPRVCGGLCERCKPDQAPHFVAPSGNAVSLKDIEALALGAQAAELEREARRENLRGLKIERADLRRDLAAMEAHGYDAPYSPTGPTYEEIEAAKDRLEELDELLIFEDDDDAPIICGFEDPSSLALVGGAA